LARSAQTARFALSAYLADQFWIILQRRCESEISWR
jgi:hypothetical protein